MASLRQDLLANLPIPAGGGGGGVGGAGGAGGGSGWKAWAVFFACLIVSAIGVVISFAVFGSRITGFKSDGLAIVIAAIMLGISYGAKWNNADSREKFSPLDLLSFLTEGFLWPSTWPAMADFLGVQKVEPVKSGSSTGHLLDASHHLLSLLTDLSVGGLL